MQEDDSKHQLVDVLVSLNGDYHHDCNKLIAEIKKLRFELLMVAKCAADEPMFFNPLNAAHAKKIRDRVLKNSSLYVSG